MSEHLTHIAVYEDTYRLVQYSDQFPDAFKISLKNHPDVGLMSSASRGNHLFAVPFLEETRDTWDNRKKGDGTEEKIAAALGWLSHRAIDLQVKPMYLKDEDIEDPRFSGTENQIYYDAITFRNVYGSGQYPSVSPHVRLSDAVLSYSMGTHPAAALLHIDHLELGVVQLVQQNLLAIREFHKKAATPEEWLEAFPEHYQDLSENLTTYIEAFSYPDPKKMKKYNEELNFYNENDEIIRLVRDLQHLGKTNIPLEEAYAKAEAQSHYAQGLRRSLYYMQLASAFFHKKEEKEQLYDQLKIFKASHRR